MAAADQLRQQAWLVEVLLEVLLPNQRLDLGAQPGGQPWVAPIRHLAVAQVGHGAGLQAAGLGMALGPGPYLARHIAAVKGIGVAEQLGRQGCLEALLALVGPGPGQKCRINWMAGGGRQRHDKAPRRNRPLIFCSGCYETARCDTKLRARWLVGQGLVGWQGRAG